MGYFKDESFVVDVPIDKAQEVFETITGEFGKLIRDSYDKHPFTGTVKKGEFSLIPNVPRMSVKLKGTFQSEGLDRTRINISGKFLIGRLLVLFLLMCTVLIFTATILSIAFGANGDLSALYLLGVIALVGTVVVYQVMRYPRSWYNMSCLELMRKLDNHELLI